MSIVFEDDVAAPRGHHNSTIIDWSFLDKMKVGQSLLVDKVEFSEKTGWPKRLYYPHDYDYTDPNTKPDEVYYGIDEIRQHFSIQMKKRRYGYATRTVEKNKSFRVWRTS